MTERLALLPLTGAGEVNCGNCHHRVLDVCDIHGRLLSDHGKPYERFQLCVRSERDASRLRAVEAHRDRLAKAATAVLTSSEIGHIVADDWRGVVGLEALRAALKE